MEGLVWQSVYCWSNRVNRIPHQSVLFKKFMTFHGCHNWQQDPQVWKALLFAFTFVCKGFAHCQGGSPRRSIYPLFQMKLPHFPGVRRRGVNERNAKEWITASSAAQSALWLGKERNVHGEVVKLVSFSEKGPKKSWKCFCRAKVNNVGLSPSLLQHRPRAKPWRGM